VAAPKLFQPNAVRERVDRYELIGEIASGGMATVYLARLSGVGGFRRFVAMKRLHPHLAKEADFVQMFLDEARLAAGIHHPNVVPILEVGASPVGYYLVMEYIEGDTLARLLARAAGRGLRLPLAISLRVMLDALQGLHAAHELRNDQGDLIGLVHRDVSPQNILVGIDGVARITDFGVARAETRLSGTRVGQLKGKLAYMSPEQAAGEEGLDRRADVFSSAIVIWETLAGKRLFKADNEAATLSRVVNHPIPELKSIVHQMSGELSAAVMRGLERVPDRRYPTCAAFAEAIEAAAHGRDGIASSRDLAKYVKEVLGDEVEQQREAVRAWLAQSEPSQVNMSQFVPPPASPSSVSVAAMSMPSPAAPFGTPDTGVSGVMQPQRSRWPLAMLVLLLLGAAGGGGFYFARARKPVASVAAPPPPATQTAVAPKPPEPVAPPPAASTAAPAPSAVTSAEAEPAASAAVTAPKPATRAAPARRRKSKADDVDLRNPYR
jgi:serine/threonine protein kinase